VLDLTNSTVDRADKLGAKLAKDPLDLPFVAATDINSPATRNLLRGQAFRLPSGEQIARVCERPQSEIDAVNGKAATIAVSASPAADLSAETPLWPYILFEAGEIGRETNPDDFDQGEGLGPVGRRSVAETLIGLMELDDHSYLSRQYS
jgi:hypothetical protein